MAEWRFRTLQSIEKETKKARDGCTSDQKSASTPRLKGNDLPPRSEISGSKTTMPVGLPEACEVDTRACLRPRLGELSLVKEKGIFTSRPRNTSSRYENHIDIQEGDIGTAVMIYLSW